MPETKQRNLVQEGEPMPEGMGGVLFYVRQSLGLIIATMGIVVTVVCFDKYYYGYDNLAVTWAGLILACVGLAVHETRPYKRYDDWTLFKGYMAQAFTEDPAQLDPSAPMSGGGKKESKKKK